MDDIPVREDLPQEDELALAAMGANVIHVGGVGSGEVAKLCNNLIAGVAAVAVSEAEIPPGVDTPQDLEAVRRMLS